jgi:hypothetical protein
LYLLFFGILIIADWKGFVNPLLPIFFNYFGVGSVELANLATVTATHIFQSFVPAVTTGLAGIPVMVGEFVPLYIVAPVEVKVVAFFVGVIQQASAGVSFVGVVRAINCVYGAMVVSHHFVSLLLFLSDYSIADRWLFVNSFF